MAANSRHHDSNGRNGKAVSGKGRFGGEAFGQVTAYMRQKELDAFEIATYAFLTIRAAEQEKTPLDEVKASPQDIARDIRRSRTTAAKALDGLERKGFIEMKEGGEGMKARWKLNFHKVHIEEAHKHAEKIIERRRKEWKKRHPKPQGAARKLAHTRR